MMTANALFTGDNSKSAMDEDFYREVLGVIEVIAEASLVEPSWKELQDEGIELTDDQYTFLFNYTQKGIKALEPFRGEQPGTGNN